MLTPITDTIRKVMWTGVIRTYYMCSVGPPFEPGGLKYVVQETKYDKVIYSVKQNTYIVIKIKLATCSGSSETSSDQHLIYGHGAFNECAHYGIPYCLQTIFKIQVKNLLVDVSFTYM